MVIVTDTASDILESEARELDVRLAAFDISFGEEHCSRNTPQDLARFYNLLTTSEVFPKTSQPSPESYLEYIHEGQKRGEDVLIIALTSTISGSVESARLAAKLSGYDRVAVVDSRQAIVSERMVVEYACHLRNEGKTLEETVAAIKDFSERIQISGILDTLTYLQKGGRIPASLARIGNLLKIKPLVAVEDGVLMSPTAARGTNAAKKAIWKRLDPEHLDTSWPIYFVYADRRDLAEKFAAETIEKFELDPQNTRICQISGTVGAHLGPGCFGYAFLTK
ncbi:MAG TPA: DegV family protein [Slackia equolifaciens]|uniref:DegV family protein n=1 Tax=Slackia equolifaciens TaxID=498718 RepID=A0A9D2UUY5_9ACTN|nr:DegV family protein [Slackia equolifaciens]